MTHFLSFLLLLSLLSSCTVEQSAEERVRDDTDRASARLRAACGSYLGYFQNSQTDIVPVSLDVQVTLNPTSADKPAASANPTTDSPVLSAGLRIGLFGGVTIASTSTSYDWGTGEFVATFSRKASADRQRPGGTGIELRGYIKDGSLAQGTLIGPHFGSRTLVLEKGGKNLFESNTDTEHFFAMTWTKNSSEPPLQGLMKIKSKSLTQAAPDTSDLPYLPGLDVSLEFQSFAVTPQNARLTFYDPVMQTLEIQLTEVTWLKISGLFLSSQTFQTGGANGSLTMGGVSQSTVQLVDLIAPPVLMPSPPVTYLGTYQGSPEALVLKAVAYLSFLGTSGSNQLDLPFPTFPQMRMEIDICNGDIVFNQTVMKLSGLDYLNHKAVFHEEQTAENPLEITYQNDWSGFKGKFLQVDPHAGGGLATVKFRPNATVMGVGCGAK